MSDHDVQSYNEGNGRVGRSRRLCQSVWMSHWSDTSSKTASRDLLNYKFKQVGNATEHQAFLSRSEIETDISIFARESREVRRLVTNSLNLKTEQSKPFPMFNVCGNKDSMLAIETEQTSRYESHIGNPIQNSNFQRLENKPVKFHNFFEKNSLAASRSCIDDFTGSTSRRPDFSVTRQDEDFFGKPLEQMGILLRLKNESSADTDSMEMNASQESRLFGRVCCPSNKNVDWHQVSPLSQVPVTSTIQDAGQTLLDINQRLSELSDDRDTSSSRTQSLDVERLLSNSQHYQNSKSNAWQDRLAQPDPSSRWIKRLKMTNSYPLTQCTKISNMPEPSSHETSKIIIRSATSSETSKSKCNGNDGMKLDQATGFLRNAELSTDSAHSWIRRWSHNQALTAKKTSPEANVTCEPESFKKTSDKFQKKQFPSIAGMALMGKAMRRFRPCQFQKLGPSVVWNTERF